MEKSEADEIPEVKNVANDKIYGKSNINSGFEIKINKNNNNSSKEKKKKKSFC